jgi:hypothetical protein
MPLRDISRLLKNAPNLLSWIGGNIFRLEDDASEMSDTDKKARLRELSDHYDLTDEQVIEKAESGMLPPDPEFAELIDRSSNWCRMSG